jgi:hypothetical protein
MSRNIVAGSVRLCYAVVYAIFLGFGLAMGNEAFERIFGTTVFGPEDYTCSMTHNINGPWYQKTPSKFWGMCLLFIPRTSHIHYIVLCVAFLTVPMYSLFLSLKIQAPYNRKEIVSVSARRIVLLFVDLFFQSFSLSPSRVSVG